MKNYKKLPISLLIATCVSFMWASDNIPSTARRLQPAQSISAAQIYYEQTLHDIYGNELGLQHWMQAREGIQQLYQAAVQSATQQYNADKQ